MEPADRAPGWLRGLLARVESAPETRIRDADLREMNLDPARVRRWFQRNHQMTFQAYCPTRRLGLALGAIQGGHRVTDAARDSG